MLFKMRTGSLFPPQTGEIIPQKADIHTQLLNSTNPTPHGDAKNPEVQVHRRAEPRSPHWAVCSGTLKLTEALNH